MTTHKTSHPLNTFAFVSEEMERTLRLRAWKDEIFRESLIADPKGVIQRLFPQCFPNGKLPEELTIKVIEEDPDICHIVVPFLPEEFLTAEIPEEEQLELLAYMGSERGLGRRDSSEQRPSQSSEKRKVLNLDKKNAERQQAEQAAKQQETESKSLTTAKIESLAKKNENFHNKLVEVSQETSPEQKQKMLINTLKEYFPHYFTGSNGSERQAFKVTQDTADTRHLVLPKLPDASHNPAVPEIKFDSKANSQIYTECCQPTRGCK